MFFFFKQKTAYEMRISDWSSDVCSSDLNSSPAHQFYVEQIVRGTVCSKTPEAAMPRRVVATIGLFGLASSAGAGIRSLGYRANKARRPVGLADPSGPGRVLMRSAKRPKAASATARPSLCEDSQARGGKRRRLRPEYNGALAQLGER